MESKIRLGSDEIKFMTLFESLTGATVVDCVKEENTLGFLVKKGDMGRAIGKQGANIEKVRQSVGRSVLLVEEGDNQQEFMKKLFEPVRIRKIQFKENDGEKNAVIEVDKKDRRKVLGSEGMRIKIARQLARRHHMIDDIVVHVV